MIKLHGIALSNYTNVVRTALVEKGIPYEFVVAMPSQEDDYLAKSPMGKVPCLETDEGFLAETHPILDYLEEIHPVPTLLPSTPFARAKVRELVQSLELYIELAARKGLGLLFGRDVPDHVKESMKRELPKGLAAVGRLVKFSPWIAGDQFTYADLFGYYTFALGNLLAKGNADIDLLAGLPGAAEWFARVGARDSVKAADADMAKAQAAMRR
jgi:glutathione S-transferase